MATISAQQLEAGQPASGCLLCQGSGKSFWPEPWQDASALGLCSAKGRGSSRSCVQRLVARRSPCPTLHFAGTAATALQGFADAEASHCPKISSWRRASVAGGVRTVPARRAHARRECQKEPTSRRRTTLQYALSTPTCGLRNALRSVPNVRTAAVIPTAVSSRRANGGGSPVLSCNTAY